MNFPFILISILFIFSRCIDGAQYLRMDTFDDATCSLTSGYSTQWIKMDTCNGQYVYRFVADNVGTPSTTNGIPTTGANPLTTANTLTSIDLTSIVTQVVTLGMTGSGGLKNGLTGLTGGNLKVANLLNEGTTGANGDQTGASIGTTTAESNTLGVTNPPVSTDASTSSPLSTGSIGTTTESNTVGAPLSSTSSSLPTSSLSTSSLPTSSLSTTSILTNTGVLSIGATSIQGVTNMITDLITAGLTNGGSGSATTSVQGGMGNVVLYYCLSASGCLTQCVSIKSFPLGVCTQKKLDHVIYSVANNTELVTEINNTTNSGDKNGYCQSISYSSGACIGSQNEYSQYKNDHCGKGMKVNCTSSVYSVFNCIDSNCMQCSKAASTPLDQCVISNGTGTIYKSLLKFPITDSPPVTFPPMNGSSSSDSISHEPTNSFAPQTVHKSFIMLLFIILIVILF